MTTTATLKDVKVKLTEFTKINTSGDLNQYVIDCVGKGSKAKLFKNPAIRTSFYAEGKATATAIQTAITECIKSPTDANELTILNKMALALLWLKKYAVLVEKISNSDINRSTREEAATNISRSFLTYQQLEVYKKGDPETPKFTVLSTGTGRIKVRLTNGASYKPSRTTIIAVELPPATVPPTSDPIVTINGNQLRVLFAGGGEVITQSLTGKGRSTTITVFNTSSRYMVFGFSQNGNKQVSKLSAGVVVKL